MTPATSTTSVASENLCRAASSGVCRICNQRIEPRNPVRWHSFSCACDQCLRSDLRFEMLTFYGAKIEPLFESDRATAV